MRVCPACGSPRVSDGWLCPDCGAQPAVIDGFTAFAPAMARENSGFRGDYFAELAALEAGNFWFRARNELIVWALTTWFPDARDLLEVGCGTGFVLRGIHAARPAIELTGSEIFSTGLAFAQERLPGATFYQMDARHIPFRDEFDVIGAFDVLEHIDDDAGVIAEIGRALRPGGGFLISVPQHPALWSRQDVNAFHVRRYTAGEIRRKLEAAGFEIVRMTSFVSLLLPLMFASRMRMRGSVPGTGDELEATETIRQPRALDLAFRPVMAVERALIRLGLSFPAGGSLLVVARKPDPAGAQP